jgi:hypothetical protein
MASTPKSPIYRLKIYAEKYPEGSGTDLLVSSLEDHADTEYAEGRAWAFDRIERQLSDASGEHFLAQATVRHDDQDFFWRTRGATTATQYLDGRDATLDVISSEALELGSIRTTLLRGKCRGVDLDDGMGATILLEELIGSEFGPAFLDKRINPRTLGDGGVFPQLAPDLQDRPVQLVIGENNDRDRVNQDGTSAEKGTCPGYYVGDFDITTTEAAPATPTLLPPPTWQMTYDRFGSGGNTTWTYAVAVRTATGRTTLGAITTISGLPDDGSFTQSNGVVLHLAQYPAALQQYVVGAHLYVKKGSQGSTNQWHFMDGAGEIFNTAANDPFNAGPNWNSGDIGYEDNGDDHHHKGFNPPPATNTATIPTTTTGNGTITVHTNYGLIVFADSAVTFRSVWGSDGGEDVDAEPVRVEWTLGMEDVLMPGDTGWPHANPWIDLIGTDGVTRRFAGIYVNGPRLEHHKQGRVTIAANICGRTEDANDPDTPVIDQFGRVWQHMFSEQVWGNDGLGYYTGAWTGLPTFADGTEAISSPSVQLAEALSATLTGTTKGYLTAFCLTEPMTVREFLRKWNQNYTSFSYTNRHGQLSLALVDTTADPTSGTPFRQDIDEVSRVSAPKERREWTENRIRGQFDWDADAKRFVSTVQELKSDTSQARLGAAGRKTVREREVYDCFFIRDQVTFSTAQQQRKLLYQLPPRICEVQVGPTGFNVDIMDRVLVSTHEGYGATGYNLQPMLVIGHTTIPGDPAPVVLTCWDMGVVLTQQLGQLVGGVRVWDSGADLWDSGSKIWG